MNGRGVRLTGKLPRVLNFSGSAVRYLRESNRTVNPMRFATALAILLGTASAASADGFDLVVPMRPGVPIIVNGIDISYAVVEGDFGLGKGVHRQPTGLRRPLCRFRTLCRPLLPELRQPARLRTNGDCAAGRPQAAETGRDLPAVLGGPTHDAAGPTGPAAGAARRHPCSAARLRPLARNKRDLRAEELEPGIK